MVTVAETYQLPWSRPLTAADLEEMPDDGHRYELIDGALIVTPSPAVPHQVVVGNVYSALRAVCPHDVRVMLAPLDITVSELTVMQPDLLVATREALSGRKLVGVPSLAIEVLSPSTRLIDLNLKKAAFERAGVASYWVVDPEQLTITVWELVDGAYAEVASAASGRTLSVERPFPIALEVGTLLD